MVFAGLAQARLSGACFTFNPGLCRLQVLAVWLETASLEAEQQILWNLEHMPAAAAQQQQWLLRHGLRLWRAAHHICLGERAADARRRQAWQQVNGWLGELRQPNNSPDESRHAPAAEGSDDQWLEDALLNSRAMPHAGVYDDRVDPAWLESGLANHRTLTLQPKDNCAASMAMDDWCSSQQEPSATEQMDAVASGRIQHVRSTQEGLVDALPAELSHDSGNVWLADLLA